MPKGGRRPGAGRKKGTPNKATAEIKELAGKYTKEALSTLVEIAKKGESEQARVSAANSILDRAHGKPAQAVKNDDDDPLKIQIESIIVDPERSKPGR